MTGNHGEEKGEEEKKVEKKEVKKTEEISVKKEKKVPTMKKKVSLEKLAKVPTAPTSIFRVVPPDRFNFVRWWKRSCEPQDVGPGLVVTHPFAEDGIVIVELSDPKPNPMSVVRVRRADEGWVTDSALDYMLGGGLRRWWAYRCQKQPCQTESAKCVCIANPLCADLHTEAVFNEGNWKRDDTNSDLEERVVGWSATHKYMVSSKTLPRDTVPHPTGIPTITTLLCTTAPSVIEGSLKVVVDDSLVTRRNQRQSVRAISSVLMFLVLPIFVTLLVTTVVSEWQRTNRWEQESCQVHQVHTTVNFYHFCTSSVVLLRRREVTRNLTTELFSKSLDLTCYPDQGCNNDNGNAQKLLECSSRFTCGSANSTAAGNYILSKYRNLPVFYYYFIFKFIKLNRCLELALLHNDSQKSSR
jgi:hypothetical protein